MRTACLILRLLTAACFLHACAAPKQASVVNSRVVAAIGEGTTRDQAMAAARRDAVRQVAGEFVKSRTELEDEQLVLDQIVSMSDGYVLSSEVLREERLPDGTVRVKIAAQVVDDRMQLPAEAPKVAAVMKDQSSSVLSQREREVESARMLQLVLDESKFPLGMFDAIPTQPVAEPTNGGARISWQVTVRANPARWRRFVTEAGHALAALGAADSMVAWQPRAAGTRIRDLEQSPPIIGSIMRYPVEARLTEGSMPMLPGPRDNTVAAMQDGARDRTVLFIESSSVAARSFTISRRGFDVLSRSIVHAARTQPMLRARLLDGDGAEALSIQSRLDMNASACVLLLAELRDGVPAAIPAGAGRVPDGRPMPELRPLMLLPAIGIDGVLLREFTLPLTIDVPNGLAARVESVECTLVW